jgi:hypothetical protein
MRRNILVWAALATATGTEAVCSAQQTVAPPMSRQASPLAGGRAQTSYGNLPLTFEANQGQTSSAVKFLARGNGYTAFLTVGGIVLSLRPNQPVPVQPMSNVAAPNKSGFRVATTLQFRLLGASQNSSVIGEDPLPGRVNYFLGRDPAKWRFREVQP